MKSQVHEKLKLHVIWGPNRPNVVRLFLDGFLSETWLGRLSHF